MPEGDTLHRIANQLRPVLVGQPIRDARTWRPRSGRPIDAAWLVGRCAASVEAVGKHLMITIDGGGEQNRVLHSHLGMTGSWHVYPRDAPWKKPAQQAGLVISTTSHTIVNFSPKLLELVSEATLRGNAHLQRLGPDLMLPATDVAVILPRLRTHNATPMGEAVMNQTIAAGIGNVYKSESLFLANINPWRAVCEFSDQQLLDYLRHTQRLMWRNRGGGKRVTRFAADGQRVWVYGRAGEACLVCGDKVLMKRQGDLGRSTYWCPQCQPSTP